jgi:Asp-tRNA(Asn)/Glu-tRNA(Gln) amidotransferase A subunit family amidase
LSDQRRLSRRDFLGSWRRSATTPGGDETPAGLTIAEAGRRLASRELSPVELTQAVLNRVQRLDPLVGAYVTRIDPERCLDLARQAETDIGEGRYRGKLHGIPFAVKDTHYTTAMPTTAGSPLLEGYTPRFDATVVSRLEQGGAILIGKTNLPEWSFGGGTPGTHNPWDLDSDPGGSSGGSAAAVAADLVLGATGGDTSGSIRSPALICGVVGFKPTYGRVSCYGVVPISWSLDHVGPVVKCVEDAAIVLGGIAGPDPNDANSAAAPVPVFTARLRRGIRGWTIGTPPESAIAQHDAESLGAFGAALQVFRQLGATVREVPLPTLFPAAQATQRIIRIAEAAAYHRQYLHRPPEDYGVGSAVRRQVVAGSLISSAAYQRAQQVRAAFIRQMREMFAEIDVYVTPGWRTSLNPRAYASSPPLSSMFNLCGFPALVLPAGFTNADSIRPLGVQIVGRPFEEDVVLAAAYAYEQATDWHTRKPDL